jgi:hypothetical protein
VDVPSRISRHLRWETSGPYPAGKAVAAASRDRHDLAMELILVAVVAVEEAIT